MKINLIDLFNKAEKQAQPQETKLQKEEVIAKKSIQDLIPIKDIENGFLITPDNRMVQMIKVSGRNLELLSIREVNELFEIYEEMIMKIDYHIMETNVSMAIDLRGYIEEQRMILENTTNPYKRELLEDYIQYTEEIEVSQDIMQRQRYLVFYEKLKSDTPEEREKTALALIDKREELISDLAEMELDAEPLTDLEIIRYFHTLFDYETALNRPITSAVVPQVIKGGKL